MSKTAQRKAAAVNNGYRDRMQGKPRAVKPRNIRADYNNGYSYACMDLAHQRELANPRPKPERVVDEDGYHEAPEVATECGWSTGPRREPWQRKH